MVPEGIISVAQLVAEADFLIATLAIGIYALVTPRIPELREIIASAIGLAKTEAERKTLNESQKNLMGTLNLMFYGPIMGVSLSFMTCIVAIDAASGALTIEDELTRLPLIEAANFWLVGAILLLALSFLAVLVEMGPAQRIVATAEEWRKRPPKEFERFRP